MPKTKQINVQILNRCIKLYLPSFNDLIQKDEIDTYAMEITQNHPKNLRYLIQN